MYHGSEKRFVVGLGQDLGAVDIANLRWDYDHDIDPLDLTKVCVLLCSDHVHVQSVTVTSLSTAQ